MEILLTTSHILSSHTGSSADFPCHCAVTNVLPFSYKRKKRQSHAILAWCRWGSWIILPKERLDPAVCVWLKSRKGFGSQLQLWFAETNGWANEPLKASLICPMALLESQDGEATEGAAGVLFVEGAGQLKLGMTVCMFGSHATAMLALNACWNAETGAAALPVNLLEAKLKMKSWTVPASCESQLLKFLLRAKLWLI